MDRGALASGTQLSRSHEAQSKSQKEKRVKKVGKYRKSRAGMVLGEGVRVEQALKYSRKELIGKSQGRQVS